MGKRVPARRSTAKKSKKAPAAKAKRAKRTSSLAVKTKKKTAVEVKPLDLAEFPPESVTLTELWICVACIWEVFIRHMQLTPSTALAEIKRYSPSVDELNARTPVRPFFSAHSSANACPYCGASSKWLARLPVYRIESGKATDAPRRELVKSLPQTGNPFAIVEQKATQQIAFLDWLKKMSQELHFDDPRWLREVSRHYLGRKLPKVDWEPLFRETHSVRRSRRLEEGWEVDTGRLFLCPTLFDELLLVQYMVSRSHQAGGVTFEGRYTLNELFSRLRNAGYLRAVGVPASNPGDALEKLIEALSGGDASLRFYYIVDRRHLLEAAKLLKTAKPAKARAQSKAKKPR